jgi:aspartate kinase
MVVVSKFGGTSVKDGPAIERAMSIMKGDPRRRIAVFSAPGKRSDSDIKVTDALIEAGVHFCDTRKMPDLAGLKERFLAIAAHFKIEDSFLSRHFTELEQAINRSDCGKAEHIDGIKPYGEIINTELIAEAMRRTNMDAIVLRPEEMGMVLSGEYGNSRLLDSSYPSISKALEKALSKHALVLVPGFYGVNETGTYQTFARGGSDLTGSILAHAIDAERYDNFTDVTGVKKANPKLIPDAETIHSMTFDEMEELGITGAEVIMYEAIEPLVSKGIPLHVRSTFEPEGEHTVVSNSGSAYDGITGISSKQCWIIDVKKRGIRNTVGYGAHLYKVFEEGRLSYDYTYDTINTISVIISAPSKQGDRSERMERLQAVQATIEKDPFLLPDSVSLSEYSLVSVVAEGLSRQKGIMCMLSSALYEAGINIYRTNQASDRTVLFVVETADAERAVKAIYENCIKKK